MTSEQLAAISRLFSSSVIREMARKGQSPLFARLASQSLLMSSLSADDTVYNFFDAAYSLLKQRGNRDEYIYKAALTHNILLGIHSLQTASMLTEFRVGECKADVVILNGTASVYEVKSERDTLSRLERQVTAYAKVFAKVYVISAECHADAVLGLVPKEVGIMCLKNGSISKTREAVDCRERTSPAAIFYCLRSDEARRILALKDMPIPAVPNTELSSVLRELFIKLTPCEAHEGMVQVLKKTRNLLPLSDLVSQLPHSLKPAALSVSLRKLDHSRLVAAVNTRLIDAMTWA